ncbi:MAG: T9SS type A sorting domain-containing protein [Saprospiraceae bacterium]
MRYLIIGFLVLVISNNLICQVHTWQRTNPGGGGAYSTVGASASGIIIAGSDLSGTYRSTDGGLSWDIIGANRGLTETHVSGIGFHRTDGDMLFIGTENGIFRSSDGGNSVTHTLEGGYITDIEFGTNEANIGYASSHPTYNSNNGVIYRTQDNGQSWIQSSTNLPNGIRILKIVVNPDDANIVYILTGLGRFACGPAAVFRSSDSGVTWTHLTNTLPEILDLAIDPSNPDDIYITTMNADCSEPYYWTDLDGDLYKSNDGGASWGIPIYNQSGIIWVDTENPSTIRLIDPREPFPWIASSGTWTSTNNGNSFTKTGDVNDWDIFFNNDLFHCYSSSYNGICKTLGEDLSNSNNYFWVNYQWIFKTTDNGKNFNNIFTDEIAPNQWKSRGFDNVNMMDVSISKANPDIIFTAYFDIGLWRSLDSGVSWQSCNDESYSGNWQGNGGNCSTVVTDPDRSNVVWATQSGNQSGESPTHLLKNTNTGDKTNWTLSDSGLPIEEIMGLSIDENSPIDARVLYVTALGDVYKSSNDGASWTSVLNGEGFRFTAVDYINDNLIYSGGENGLWRSSDGGANWMDISHPQMKASSGIGFWDREYDGVFDIKTDPNNENWIYVTVLGNNKGLYKSIDKGNNWIKILTDDYMRKVAIVPRESNMLYATSSSAFDAGGYDVNSNGIWFSDDGGQTWSQHNHDMAYPFALAIAIDNTIDPIVFVGSPGSGFQKSKVPSFTLTNESITDDKIINIYPNPFENKITIDGDFNNCNIKLLDPIGNLVSNFLGTNSPLTIDLSSLESGLYFLSVRHKLSSSLRTYKIVKQR